MAKRHTKQTEQQALGQFFTTNAERILSGWERYVAQCDVVDPFAGGWDLLNWARENGAKSVSGFDIDPKNEQTIFNDSLRNPPDLTDKFLISNPPYLASNKSKGQGKDIFEKYQQNDYYKCHLAALIESNVERGIMIIPSNFWCESSTKIRRLFFSHFRIIEAKYWTEPVFDNATTGITAFVFERGVTKLTPIKFLPENRTTVLNTDNSFLIHGGDFLESIDNPRYHFNKLSDINTKENILNIIVGTLDNGRYSTGFHIYTGLPLLTPKTIITTFQITSPTNFTQQQQTEAVHIANEILNQARNQYDSMFLSNYMGARQKIMSVSIANKVLSKAFEQIIDSPLEHFILK